MKKLILSAMVFAVIAGSASGQNLLISEYLEGSFSNKALEILNVSGGALDYSLIEFRRYNNGSVTPAATFTPTLLTPFADGDVYVVANSGANATILGVADETDAITFFNGDDALELYYNGVLQDSIGQVGFDPGTNWSGSGVATSNQTLVRKNTTPDTNSADAYDPSVQFNGLVLDDASDLGIGTVPVEVSAFELE